MAKSDSLFQLIQAMSKAEKRYFKLHSEKYEGRDLSQYLALFDLIAAQEQYDEEALRSNLPAQLHPRNFSFAKTTLYGIILRTLRNYHAQRTPKIQLQEMMMEIYLLHEKGLSKEVSKHLRKARKIAEKYGYDHQLLELNLLERRLLRRVATKQSKADLVELQAQTQHLQTRLALQIELLDLYERAFLMMRDRRIHPEAVAELQRQISPTLQHFVPQPDTSLEMRITYHLFYSLLHYMKGEPNERARHLRALIEFFESHPELLADVQYRKRYLGCINNYFNYLINNRRPDQEVEAQIQALHLLNPSHPSLATEVRLLGTYFRMLYHLQRQRYAEIVQMESEIEALLYEHEKKISSERRLAFLFNLALAMFLEKHLSRALKLLNRILNQPETSLRLDLHLFSRILIILIFIEREEFTTAEYQIISALHFYDKHSKGQLEPMRRVLQSCKRLVQYHRWEELDQLAEYLTAQNGYEELCMWIRRVRPVLQ